VLGVEFLTSAIAAEKPGPASKSSTPSSGKSRDAAFQYNLTDIVQPFDVLIGCPGINRHRAYTMVRLADKSGL
jgi:hypothetical protein